MADKTPEASDGCGGCLLAMLVLMVIVVFSNKINDANKRITKLESRVETLSKERR